MIINKLDKSFQTRSDKPNTNWLNDNNYFVVPDGSPLANQIINTYPYFEFILDENDNLVGIAETERPEPEVEMTQDEINLDFDYRLSVVELGLV